MDGIGKKPGFSLVMILFQKTAAIILGIVLVFLPTLGSSETIGLDDFLRLIKQNHPLIEKEALQPRVDSVSRERLLTAQDWRLGATSSLRYSDLIVTSPFAPNNTTDLSLWGGLERTLWSTGGMLRLGWRSDFTDQQLNDISIPSDTDPISISSGLARLYQHRLSIDYSQPLLRNYGGKLDRLDYKVGGFTVDASKLEAMENQEALLLDLGLRYIDWVLLEQQRQIGQERLRLSEEQLNHLKEKREANLVDEVDVLRAEDAMRIAYQNVVLLDASIAAKKTELAVLSRTPSIREADPAFDLYALIVPMDPVVEFQRIAQESRVLNALRITKEGLAERKGGIEEAEKPILDLNVGFGLKSGDDRFGDSWRPDKPDFTVAFEFLHQLGSRGAKNDVARTEIQIDQLDAQIEEVSISLEAAVHSVLIRIRQLQEVLALNRDEIQSAHNRTEEEIRLYEQGRGDLTFVIQSRDNEQNARLRYAANAADYHRLLLQFREIADDLL